jgi:hypothetical protein
MGTPHRGTDAAGWGEMARRLALVFETNPTLLRDLDPNVDTGMLEELREDFAVLLKKGRFSIYSVIESDGMRVLAGNKVTSTRICLGPMLTKQR